MNWMFVRRGQESFGPRPNGGKARAQTVTVEGDHFEKKIQATLARGSGPVRPRGLARHMHTISVLTTTDAMY